MEVRVLEDSVELEGYINVVERQSKVMTDHKRNKRFIEVIRQGTFKRAIENNSNILMLLNHDMTKQIGSTKENVELREDSIGLHYKATIKDAETMELAKNNKLKGCSFGFNKAVGTYKPFSGGIEQRSISDLSLVEVSILSEGHVPAYDSCSVEIRSNDENIELEIREFNLPTEEEIKVDMSKVYEAELFIVKNR